MKKEGNDLDGMQSRVRMRTKLREKKKKREEKNHLKMEKIIYGNGKRKPTIEELQDYHFQEIASEGTPYMPISWNAINGRVWKSAKRLGVKFKTYAETH